MSPITIAGRAIGGKFLAWGAGLVLVALASVIAWQALTISGLRVDVARLEKAAAEETTRRQIAVSAALTSYRAEEARRRAAQEESRHEALEQAARADAARRDADAAAGRLRQHLAALAGQCGAAPGGSGAAAGSPPAAAPGDLLADVSRRLEAAGRELATYAERAAIAGAKCERDYDAVTNFGAKTGAIFLE